MTPVSLPDAEALRLLFERESMRMALECMCVRPFPASLCVCVCGSASRLNAGQAGRQSVSTLNQKQVIVSAPILLQAFPPVFLFHSLFLSISQ